MAIINRRAGLSPIVSQRAARTYGISSRSNSSTGMHRQSLPALFTHRAHSPGGHIAEAATHCPKSRPFNSCARQSSTQISLLSADDLSPSNSSTGMHWQSLPALFTHRAHSPGGHIAEAATHCPKSRPFNSCAQQNSTHISLLWADDLRPPNTPTIVAAPIPAKNNRKASRRDIPLARSLESLSKCFFIRSFLC